MIIPVPGNVLRLVSQFVVVFQVVGSPITESQSTPFAFLLIALVHYTKQTFRSLFCSFS